MRRGEILVGLDLGSSRIRAVVADLGERELPEILGAGEARAEGIEAGVVVNMERAGASIRAAVEEAEQNSATEIGGVCVAIGGEHIKGIDSRGVIAVSRTGGEITDGEVSTVLEAAKTLALPVGRTILDVLPQEFFVDSQTGIRDPVGMSGVRLGSKVHIVTASEQSVDNVVRACRKGGVYASGVTLKPLAAGRVALSDDEKELGVLLINMGAGTTGLALYHGGAVRHTGVIGWGAASVTNDIAVGLRVPVSRAELLKREYGRAKSSLTEDVPIEIPSVGGHPPRLSSAHMLAAIVEPRVREILDMVANEIGSTDYWGRIPAGVVLTGGGAKLKGICDVTEEVFGTQARVGLPERVSGLCDAIADPAYAACVGAVLGATRSRRRRRSRADNAITETFQRVRQWVDNLL